MVKVVLSHQSHYRGTASGNTDRLLQHQQDLYHKFIDFKKAFDSVWHDKIQQEGLVHLSAV